MRTTPRVAAEINRIIQEEMQAIRTAQRERPGIMRRGEVQEHLVEAGPDMARVDVSILTKELEDGAFDMGMDMGMEMLSKFRHVVARQIAELMNQHAMTVIRVNPRTLFDELEEVDPEALQDAEEECVSAVAMAFSGYAARIGGLAHYVVGVSSEDEEPQP